MNAVGATFGETPVLFPWGGPGVTAATGYSGIFSGADALADMINTHTFQPGESLNIVAHSHGGNVAILATWLLLRPVDNLVNLATPQNWDLRVWVSAGFFSVAPGSVRNYCNVSSFTDPVQFLGSSPYQIGQWVGYVYNGSIEEVFAWQAFLRGDYMGFWEYQSRAAWSYAEATWWWLTTKVDPWATNVMFGSGSHSDMHSAAVWNSIRSSCGLPQ